MTVVVTRNVPDRFRGFLASCMLEVGPGVYTGPKISKAVRERIWKVLEGWFCFVEDASVVMLWSDGSQPSGQGVMVLGSPPLDIIDVDGMFLSRRRSSSPDSESVNA